MLVKTLGASGHGSDWVGRRLTISFPISVEKMNKIDS